MSGAPKCRHCIHHRLEYSKVYKTYVEGCEVADADRSKGCIDTFKKKEPPKAFIKRRR